VLSILRAALLSLLVLALPLQGLAGVGVLGCHGDAGWPSAASPGDVLHAGHPGPDAHAHHGLHPGDDHGEAPASADGADTPASCSVCAACCLVAAPAASPVPLAHAAQPERRLALAAATPDSAPPHRLERPPRPRLPA
jgi:hypothetical protein